MKLYKRLDKEPLQKEALPGAFKKEPRQETLKNDLNNETIKETRQGTLDE